MKIQKSTKQMLLIILALLLIAATARFIRTNNLIGVELPEGDTKLIKYINMMNNTVHFLNTEEEKALGVDWASYMYTPERLRDRYGLAPLPEKLYIAKEHIVGDGVVEETREEYIDRAYSLLDKYFEEIPKDIEIVDEYKNLAVGILGYYTADSDEYKRAQQVLSEYLDKVDLENTNTQIKLLGEYLDKSIVQDKEYKKESYDLLMKYIHKMYFATEAFYQENIKEYASRYKSRELNCIEELFSGIINDNIYKNIDWEKITEDELNKIYLDCFKDNSAILGMRIGCSYNGKYKLYSSYLDFIKNKNFKNKIYNGLRVRHMVNNRVSVDIDKLNIISPYNKTSDTTYIKDIHNVMHGEVISLFGDYYIPISVDGRLAGLLLLSDRDNYIPEVLTEDLITAIRILNSTEDISEKNPIEAKIIDGRHFIISNNITVYIPDIEERLSRKPIADTTSYKVAAVRNPDWMGASITDHGVYEEDILQLEPNTYFGIKLIYTERKETEGYNVLEYLEQLKWDYEYDISDYFKNRYPDMTIISGSRLMDNEFRHNLEKEWLYDIDSYAYTFITDAFSHVNGLEDTLKLKRQFMDEDWFEYDSDGFY